MPKALLSNRIYMDLDGEERLRMSNDLTYKIPSFHPSDPPQVIKNLTRVKPGLVSIPSGRVDLIPEGYEIIDKRVLKPVTFPKFKFDLRPSQKEVYDDIEDCAIINAWVSWGNVLPRLIVI